MAQFVYILYSSSIDRFYVGETVNVSERIIQHNDGFYDGSFSRQAKDWELYFEIECTS